MPVLNLNTLFYEDTPFYLVKSKKYTKFINRFFNQSSRI